MGMLVPLLPLCTFASCANLPPLSVAMATGGEAAGVQQSMPTAIPSCWWLLHFGVSPIAPRSYASLKLLHRPLLARDAGHRAG